jgi:hypothetical protein
VAAVVDHQQLNIFLPGNSSVKNIQLLMLLLSCVIYVPRKITCWKFPSAKTEKILLLKID